MPQDNVWSLLIIDDDKESSEPVEKYLNGLVVTDEGGKLRIHCERDFNKALDELESNYYDLLVLDVRLGPHDEQRDEEAGIQTLNLIKQRRFLPVIFYTALPYKVRHLETSLIRVVEKTEGVPKILEEIKGIFKTKIPFINRAFMRHLEEVQRYYMWDFVAANWGVIGDTEDKSCLAYLMARRLARSLDSPGVKRFAEKIGGYTEVWWGDENVHPMRYYIMPPISEKPGTGDIFEFKKNGEKEYMVLLTPSCDIWSKADRVLFVKCLLLSKEDECIKFKADTENKSKLKKLECLLKDNRENTQPERFKYLPGVLYLPDIVVDFQQLVTLSKEEYENKVREKECIRVASLDSPYSEAILNRFVRYFGRLGTPDLNIDLLIDRLKK